MRILRITANNLFSFSGKRPLDINLESQNLFIGPNNEGKSNILKCVQFLDYLLSRYSPKQSESILNLYAHFSDIKNSLIFLKESQDIFFNQKDDEFEILFSATLELTKEELTKCLNSLGTSHGSFKDVEEARNYLNFMFLHSAVNSQNTFKIDWSIKKVNNENIRIAILRMQWPLSKEKKYETLFDAANQSAIVIGEEYTDRYIYKHNTRYEEQYFLRHIKDVLTPLIATFLNNIHKNLIAQDKIHFIPATRVVGEFSYNNDDGNKDSAIVKKLMKLRDGRHSEVESFARIKRFLKEMLYPELEEKLFDITFPRNGLNHFLTVNADNKILPLSQLGSGVEQLISLLTEVVSRGENRIILIEEPETHFHAKLQRAFIKFIEKYANNNQYFITSHSNILIEDFLRNPVRSLYRVFMPRSEKYSTVERIKYLKEVNEILNDLGVKASDIAQSNGVIWVEGPSDRHYINKWIDLYCASVNKLRPVEGRDYSIMFYGGSNLANIEFPQITNFENEEETNHLINLLAVNRNAAVIMDRDDMEGQKFANKQRVANELSKSENSLSWITDGREIENYLSERILREVFEDSFMPRKFEPNSAKKFEEMFKKKVYSDKHKTSIKICNQMIGEDLITEAALFDHVAKLVEAIDKWNSF